MALSPIAPQTAVGFEEQTMITTDRNGRNIAGDDLFGLVDTIE